MKNDLEKCTKWFDRKIFVFLYLAVKSEFYYATLFMACFVFVRIHENFSVTLFCLLIKIAVCVFTRKKFQLTLRNRFQLIIRLQPHENSPLSFGSTAKWIFLRIEKKNPSNISHFSSTIVLRRLEWIIKNWFFFPLEKRAFWKCKNLCKLLLNNSNLQNDYKTLKTIITINQKLLLANFWK